MCKWGTDANVTLAHPMPVSGRTVIPVDSCIQPLIQVLNDYGIHTVGCCCGHGKGPGVVLYEQDGQQFEMSVPAREELTIG